MTAIRIVHNLRICVATVRAHQSESACPTADGHIRRSWFACRTSKIVVNLAQLGAATPQTGTGMALKAISAAVLADTRLAGGCRNVTSTVAGAAGDVVPG